MNLTLNIAGLLIDFDTRYPDYVRKRCASYVTDSPAGDCDMHLSVSDKEIALSDSEHVGSMEAELYAINIPLSESLPSRGRLMTHGVAIAIDGRSFIFTAESGTGKSTQAFLWQRHFGEERVKIINGDKPILWFKDDGKVYACGSPWSGKERLDENVCLPLGGIFLLDRLERHPELGKPQVKRAGQEECLDFLMHQIYIPSGAAAKIQTFKLVETLFCSTPVYKLIADMSREAVITASSVCFSTVQ